MLYFAYGSNLNEDQMKRRCPHARHGGNAALAGYRIAFGGHSVTWGGPVATIVRSRGNIVEGVLYNIPKREIALLDRCEGHPHVYVRRTMEVFDEQGIERPAAVYQLRKGAAINRLPARRYFRVVENSYIRHGLELAPLMRAVRL